MKKKSSKNLFLCFIFFVVISISCPVSKAIILHDENQPSTHPSNSVMGRWTTNGSCVAVSPDFIVTTRHQGGGLGTTVTFNGVSYKVVQIYNVPDVDLRVIRVKTFSDTVANLDFVDVYTGTGETNQEFVIGGYGKYSCSENNPIDGYNWCGSSNDVLRWGTNLVDGSQDVAPESLSYQSTCLLADFDRRPKTAYEAAIAEWDSGGGWFMDSGGWKLIAVNAYVLHPANRTLFGENFCGVRISSYANDYILPHIQNLHIISGTITDLNGNPIPSVQITDTNERTITRTNSSGCYEILLPAGLTGSLVPSKEGFSFSPSSLSFSNLNSNMTNKDFTLALRTICGTVLDSQSNALPHVMIDVNNGAVETATGSDGTFVVSVPYSWTGRIVPVRAGYKFVPEYADFNNPVTTDITNIDFDANDVNYVSDDFDDNITSANWIVNSDNQLEISETNQRVEFATNGTVSNRRASYTSNKWTIGADEDFSLKVDLHNDVSEPNDFTAYLKIAIDSNNFAIASIDSVSSGRFYRHEIVSSGSSNSVSNLLESNDHTLSVYYSKSDDTIYLSAGDYADANNTLKVQNFNWPEEELSVELGLECDSCKISSGHFYYDNFIINTGTILNWPPRTDVNRDGFISIFDLDLISAQWLDTGPDLQADIDQNQKIDLVDFASFASIW